MSSRMVLCVLGLMLPASLVAAPRTFNDATHELRRHVYFDQAQDGSGDPYCGCDWEWVGRSGGLIDHASCGYRIRSPSTRAHRLEWQHVVSAWALGQQRPCWQNGGHKRCQSDPLFTRMEADLFNILPAVGEISLDRGAYMFGRVPPTGAAPTAPAIFG